MMVLFSEQRICTRQVHRLSVSMAQLEVNIGPMVLMIDDVHEEHCRLHYWLYVYMYSV